MARWRSPREYTKRPVSARERKGLAYEIEAVIWAAKAGRRATLHVRNRTNPNGFVLHYDETTEKVSIERFITKAWAEAHGYRW